MALYTIKQGDTLFLIAKKVLGDGNRYPEILDLNPQIYDPNLIRTGDLLELPNTPAAIVAQEEDHTLINTDPSGEAIPSMSANAKILIISALAAAGAVAWWWMGKQREESPALAAASNPEEDFEEYDELAASEEDGE